MCQVLSGNGLEIKVRRVWGENTVLHLALAFAALILGEQSDYWFPVLSPGGKRNQRKSLQVNVH